MKALSMFFFAAAVAGCSCLCQSYACKALPAGCTSCACLGATGGCTCTQGSGGELNVHCALP